MGSTMIAQYVTVSREDAEDLQTNFAAGGCPCGRRKSASIWPVSGNGLLVGRTSAPPLHFIHKFVDGRVA